MSTVNSLKRPLPEPSDSCKLLACKTCEKDDVVLNLKTCGCLLCKACDGDTRDKCTSCRSNVDPKIKLSFTKNPKCKFSELNQCYSEAEYKCNCIPDCFVCLSCLTYIHRKRFRGSCVPEILRPEISFDHEPCELCEEFIAEFETTSEPHTKICFHCKTNETIELQKIVYKDSVCNLLYRVYVKSSQKVSDKIKAIEDELESSSLAREQEIKKCKVAIMKIQNCLTEYTEQSDRQIAALKQRLDNYKKISNIFKPDGTIKTILDLLKNKQLTLHGEPRKEQITGLYNYYRDKINSNHRYPLAEQIKTFIVQNVSRRQHLLQFPLPSSSNSCVPAKSDVSVQEIVDNGVKPFFILVEKPSTVSERRKVLEVIQKNEDKWVRKQSFSVNDIVIILDDDATDSPKYKRAKILGRVYGLCKVHLLDFGFPTIVENSSIGEIKGLNFNGKSTCFLAKLAGSINLNRNIEQKGGFPKAQHIQLIN